MVGALVPMVPEGLVLMTSIAFAVGVIRLGRRQCLVNELPADRGSGPRRRGVRRQDRHADRERYAGQRSEGARRRRARCSRRGAGPAGRRRRPAERQHGRHRRGLRDAARAGRATATAPFKSATKWSGTSYGEHGNWVIGAPDVLLDPASPAAEEAEQIGARGLRVLLLGSSDRARRRPRRARRGHPGRAGGARAAGPSRCPRHPGLLCLAEGLGQGDLRRQRRVGGCGGRVARPRGRDDGRPQAAGGARRSWPTPWRSTRRSAGCGPTRSARWCTRCSRAATPSR